MTKTVLALLLLAGLGACNYSRRQNNQQQEIPKALEDKSAASEIISKSRYDADLVESLYNELAEKNEDLKTLENKIQALNESKSDSTASFDGFNNKNRSYYASANRHIDGLSDSLLKTKMRTLITASLKSYNGITGRHDTLHKIIDAQGLTLADLHTVLKITRTLPLIEKYQRYNLPPAKPLEGYKQKQTEAIKLADTLIKK